MRALMGLVLVLSLITVTHAALGQTKAPELAVPQILVIVGGSSAGGVAITTLGFPNKQACENAASMIKPPATSQIQSTCVPRDVPQK